MSKVSKEKREQKEQDSLTRIAIVSNDRCKPKKCRQECKKSCPVVRMGKLCIEVSPESKIAFISEELCIGCGICVKVSYSILVSLSYTSLNLIRSHLTKRNVHSKLSRL